MDLLHESPTALQVRPTVTLQPLPGRMIRVPARGGLLMLIALIAWGIGVALVHLPWTVLSVSVLLPAGILTALVELKPRGKSPLAWAVVLARHWRRAPQLRQRRLAVGSVPGHGRRVGKGR